MDSFPCYTNGHNSSSLCCFFKIFRYTGAVYKYREFIISYRIYKTFYPAIIRNMHCNIFKLSQLEGHKIRCNNTEYFYYNESSLNGRANHHRAFIWF